MSYLYVCDQGASINYEKNRFHVRYKDNQIRSVPAETLEVIEIFGKIQITTQCLTECLKRGVDIIFFSVNGSYFGRLLSTNHVNVSRQRKQAELGKNDRFQLKLAKIIIDAKINNQIVVLRRYARSRDVDVRTDVNDMQYLRRKLQLETVDTIDKVMGYEGSAAKIYFQNLGKLVDEEFTFHKRSRRPPEDAFNSLISLGYSVVMNEIYGKIEAKGLNPYFGFMHRDREKHPTLASDLLEEWRAPLIDAMALNMLNGHEMTKENFYQSMDEPGIFLDREGFKKYINKLEMKLRTETKYLDYIDYEVSFRRAIDLQINQLVKAIEMEDPSLYKPLKIR